MKLRLTASILCLVLLSGPVAPAVELAFDESDWNNLSGLRVGERIICKTKEGITYKGEFLAFSEEAISLRVGKRDVGLRREEVMRVSVVGPPKRAEAAIIGAVFGFAAAAVLGVVVAGRSAESKGGFAVLFGTVGASAGAGVGALLSLARKTVIYRAKP